MLKLLGLKNSRECSVNIQNKKKKRKLGLENKNKKNTLITPESDTEVSSVSLSDEGFSPLVLREESEDEREGEDVKQDGSNVSINEFVLVKLSGKKFVKYFVAIVNEKPCHTEFGIGFLKKKRG